MPLPAATMRHQRGFTLLEISIVVMVIGLIVGGVLAGEEMLRGSELQRVLKEKDRVFASVETFRIKYHSLPGDFSSATNFWGVNASGCPNGSSITGTCNGNGNGIIEWVDWPTQTESYRFWQHLSLSGIYPGRFTGAVKATVYVSTGENVPAITNTGGFWIPVYMAETVTQTFGLRGQALLAAGSGTGRANFTPQDAKRLDAKVDDGMPTSGLVSASSSAWTPNCTDSDAVGADYKVADGNENCTLFFWMDQQRTGT